jgi:hypothetical protein
MIADTAPRGAEHRRTGIRPARLLMAALVAVTLVAAACGSRSPSPQVAHLGTTTPAASGSSSAGSPTNSAVAYAQCIRAHGVPNWPDPDEHGHFNAKTDLFTPQLRAALKACKDLLPGGGNMTTGGKISPQEQAQLLKYAKCMRAHGIKNFPDPTSNGLTLSPGNALDPSSPQFQAADKACRSLMPNSGDGVGTQKGGGS